MIIIIWKLEMFAFVHCLASALEVFQSLGIVHRDLKPQNLLLCHSSTHRPALTELTLKIGQNSFCTFLKETRIFYQN